MEKRRTNPNRVEYFYAGTGLQPVPKRFGLGIKALKNMTDGVANPVQPKIDVDAAHPEGVKCE